MIRQKDIFAVLLLSIITCGIYSIFWLYDTSFQLKHHLNDQTIDPGLDVLFSLICFPYLIYWCYKTSKALNRAEAYAGLPQNDSAVLTSMLAFVGAFVVSQMIIQNQLNEIAARYQQPR